MKQFFVETCGYDERLWRELEYVISDMNCYSTPLMQYMLAKMVLAPERVVAGHVEGNEQTTVREHVAERWRMVATGMGMREEEKENEVLVGEVVVGEGDEKDDLGWNAYSAAMAKVSTAFRERGAMTAGQGEALRRFFRGRGIPCVGGGE